MRNPLSLVDQRRRRWFALIVVCLAQLMNTLDATIVNLIRQGQVGEVVQTYIASRNTYLLPGSANGGTLTPGFFLRANPEAGGVDYLGNGSFSNYNGLQTTAPLQVTDAVQTITIGGAEGGTFRLSFGGTQATTTRTFTKTVASLKNEQQVLTVGGTGSFQLSW